MKLLPRSKDDPGTEKFLDYFYKGCIELLFKPFSDIPEFKNLTGNFSQSLLDTQYLMRALDFRRASTAVNERKDEPLLIPV